MVDKNLRSRVSIEFLAEGYLDEDAVLDEDPVEASIFYVDQDTGILYVRVPGVGGAEDTWVSQGGLVNTYESNPEDVGTTDPGTAGTLAARGDHVHGHGDQTALPDAHHPFEHDHTGLEGTVSHSDLTDLDANDHPQYMTEDEVLDLITPVWLDCASAAIANSDGTIDAGTHTDLHEMGGTLFSVSEVTGAPGIDLRVTWTGVTGFNAWHVNGWYVGSASHHVDIELYNNDTTNWDDVGLMDHRLSSGVYSGTLADPSPYISGGTVIMRFVHPDSGNATHDLYLDHVTIGLTVGGGGDAHPRANTVATTDPTSTDDDSEGYEVLSQWVNTATNTVWVCASAATNAAVWNTAGPGADGADGATWYDGTGAPTTGVGSEDDYYLESS